MAHLHVHSQYSVCQCGAHCCVYEDEFLQEWLKEEAVKCEGDTTVIATYDNYVHFCQKHYDMGIPERMGL